MSDWLIEKLWKDLNEAENQPGMIVGMPTVKVDTSHLRSLLARVEDQAKKMKGQSKNMEILRQERNGFASVVLSLQGDIADFEVVYPKVKELLQLIIDVKDDGGGDILSYSKDMAGRAMYWLNQMRGDRLNGERKAFTDSTPDTQSDPGALPQLRINGRAKTQQGVA